MSQCTNRRSFLMTSTGLPLLAAQQAVPGYGQKLPIVNDLGIGMCADAAVAGDTLFVIGGGNYGSLYVASLAVPAKPKVIGKLPNLGHVRQLMVRDGVAYVTSREDGMFLIDVRRPDRPTLLSHYDTIELATGLALSGNVAFVACRQWGVELIDITNPKRPAHLSTVRVGEAQSVAARSGYLYAGVWATRELVVCDVRNPRRPVRVGQADLDGFGDGVTLRGPLCFVATGHHARTATGGRPKPGEPEYGTGHGLEIFDVSRPAEPRFISRIKAPVRYRVFMDMWGVKVSGKYAFLADTYNGIFVIDVSDPAHPRFAGHRRLAEVQGRGEGYVLTDEKVPSPVGGFGIGKGHIYVAGGYSDLHVVAASGLANPAPAEPDNPASVPPPEPTRPDPQYSLWQPKGMVQDVVPWSAESHFVVPAGNDGFHVVRIGDGVEPVAHYPTEGIAFGAAAVGETVFVAEGMGGLSIWRGKRKLERIGRYREPGQSVKQVTVEPRGRFALLHVGLNRLQIVDVANPAAPRKVLEEGYLGLFYRRSITLTAGAPGGLVSWGHDGLFLYDVSKDDAPRAAAWRYPFGISARGGAVRYRDGWLVTSGGSYFLLRPGETRSPQQVGLIGIKGRGLWGKPALGGDTLFLSDSEGGKVTAVDISTLTAPRVIAEIEVPEHPGFVVGHKGVALVPGGYQGLLVWRYRGGA